MRRTRRVVSKAFADTKIVCPKCTAKLQWYGKPDWAAFLRDGKPVRLWCPKCERKFDAQVTPGITEEETKRTVREV